MHLRNEAKWTDGTPVTADDFLWEWRRALDPLTADEYSYQLWYLENAERYSERDLNPGDRVEIELHERAPDSLPFARGKMLRGKLLAVQKDDQPDSKTPADLRSRNRRPAAIISNGPHARLCEMVAAGETEH